MVMERANDHEGQHEIGDVEPHGGGLYVDAVIEVV